ncbi:MAG: hypothetical protein SFX74_02220 [Fimbriimonadaceae bacterium]|nr:hypothetical protein [Fimbriimonadaceae bacterium]
MNESGAAGGLVGQASDAGDGMREGLMMERRRMPRWTISVPGFGATAVTLTLLACGGSGGGGGGTTPPDPTITSIVIELRTADGFVVDPLQIRTGETLVARRWGRDAAGAVTEVPTTDFSTTAAGSVATITSAGAFTAVGANSGTFQIRAGDGAQTLNFRVSGGAVARVRGQVRNDDNQGVPGVRVATYTSGGTVTGGMFTGSNGSFQLNVPTTTTGFLLDMETIVSRYYNQFGYGSNEYSVVCPDFRAPVPALTNGVTTALPGTPIITRKVAGTPPPPPPDCGL